MISAILILIIVSIDSATTSRPREVLLGVQEVLGDVPVFGGTAGGATPAHWPHAAVRGAAGCRTAVSKENQNEIPTRRLTIV